MLSSINNKIALARKTSFLESRKKIIHLLSTEQEQQLIRTISSGHQMEETTPQPTCPSDFSPSVVGRRGILIAAMEMKVVEKSDHGAVEDLSSVG
ncbi:hypothetical protein AVEN_162620-1 [Araneus ventricosus]|uniref:Uncharacterized protein n=1 Tax=Araneus ventricosus TaxID=182803 RepID=A0A4Y2UKL0_ARAVE|nr:hypothetical protein AVEN_162620-1 [Araneus ventricosus]